MVSHSAHGNGIQRERRLPQFYQGLAQESSESFDNILIYSSCCPSEGCLCSIGVMAFLLLCSFSASLSQKKLMLNNTLTHGETYFGVEPVTGAYNVMTDPFSLPIFMVAPKDSIIDTKAIQDTIDEAWERGGGSVVFPPGRYTIGSTLDLKSKVYLRIDPDVLLVGSTQESDFPHPDSWEAAGIPKSSKENNSILPILIRCKGQSQVGIFGGGTIDGSAVPDLVHGFNLTDDKYIPNTWQSNDTCQGECRIQLILFERCQNVYLSNISLQNSPDWTLHVRGSENVLVDHVRIFGDWRWPNNDGIDVDSSINVTITNSRIVTADDALCIKTTRGYGPTKNILIRNNIAKSRSSAFKIGSSTMEDIEDILVENLHILADTNRGLAIQHRDAGNIQRIHFRHVVMEGLSFQPTSWWGSAEAIYISSIPRYYPKWKLGAVSDIIFEDVTAWNAEQGVFLSSRHGTLLRDVSFLDTNIHIVNYDDDSFITRLTPRLPGVVYTSPQRDYRPSEPSINGETDIVKTGMYLEGVDRTSMRTISSQIWFESFSTNDDAMWQGSCIKGDDGEEFRMPGLKCSYDQLPLY